MRKIFLWLLLLCLPTAFQKCIFDDIQPWVRVVSPLPNQPTSPKHTGDNQTRNTNPKAPQRTDRVVSQKHQRIIRQITSRTQSNSSGLLPIRIRTWIPQESFALSHVERERLELATSKAVGIVSDILSVDRIPGRMLLSRDINKFCKFIWKDAAVINYNKCARANENYRMENCLDVTIPDDHLSGCGVYLHPNSQTMLVLRPEGRGLPDTDFVLYLHTRSTDKCHAEPGVLAYAAHCQTDRRGRPLAGVVVICRNAFHGEGYSHSRMVQTIMHELFHVLGFSKELFDTWKDCSHSSRIGEDCLSHGQVTNIDGTGQVRIYTPSVIRAMQKHLGSSEEELGGPLENLAANEPSSHWEARVLQGSIMAAALDRPELVRVDPLTLAALQDTGWYYVNQSAAQRMEWGEGQGSLFGSLATCHDNSSTFFCTGSGLGCHYLHFHKGVCQSDQYLEGCRIYKPLTNESECSKESNDKINKAEEWSGEIYSPESRCFFSNLSRENISRSVPGYRGVVSCPDKGLCLSAPPPPQDSPFYPATRILGSFATDRPSTDAPSALDSRPLTSDPAPFTTGCADGPAHIQSSFLLGIVTALCLLALLSILLLVYRKRCFYGVRVHAVTYIPLVL
ncbi:ciliated left-right organizer metallopeptidase isoform X2 [Paramormyrops kingsleyae]|uniref:ciliated left-right organizer metallopeptidase isoform X2 n=1 Tax=Paramormyrops kingsleyae TaxID=1676925 RepID=UPI000CD5FAA5|nr:uncharacterized protein LOC111837730 isoform X2 [Paramormyrops kingsleyae]